MYRLTDKTILLVDDSTIMRMVITMNLKRLLGVKIVEAVNGVDALAKLSNRTFDLILTDINMPIMDGIGLVRELREKRKSDVPIVIITTRGETKDRDIGMSLGANGYITKPVDMKELMWTVLTFLRGPRRDP